MLRVELSLLNHVEMKVIADTRQKDAGLTWLWPCSRGEISSSLIMPPGSAKLGRGS